MEFMISIEKLVQGLKGIPDEAFTCEGVYGFLRENSVAAESLELRMSEHRLHQPLTQTAAAKLLQNKHVTNIREGCPITHNPCKTDLAIIVV